MPDRSPDAAVAPPVLAGVVTAVVGFTSSFAVVLAGLRAVGATDAQAGSGLLVLCLTMGAGSVLFSLLSRMPITMAWSTPGAALLAAAAVPRTGFAGAVTAFAVCGLLLTACGLVRPLADLIRRIPSSLANAMLAGVLLQLCAAPFLAVPKQPAAILPVIGVWLMLVRFRPRWAVPGALVAAVVVMLVDGTFGRIDAAAVAPTITVTAPAWDPAAVLALGVPLFLVTMTSQNIPGIAVLGSFGYHPEFRGPLTYAGLASAAGSFLGGHAINLAAISAALAAGPEAGADTRRRWIAGLTTGVLYLAIGPAAALVAAVALAAPGGLMATIAGLALLGTFASATKAALADGTATTAAAVTFVVAASGVTIAGIGSAFWSLIAGAVTLLVLRAGSGGRPPR